MANERPHYRYYTVEEAAKALSLTPARIRELAATGELDSLPPGATEQGVWKVWLPAEQSPDQPPSEQAQGAPDVPDEPPEIDQAPTHGGTATQTPEVPTEDPDSPPAVTEVARQPDEKPRGDNAASNREPTSESGWVTTQQAARALGISARTVRWHIERGNLEAKPEGEGVERIWRVSVDSLNAFRDTRQRQAQSPRGYRAPVPSAEIAAESPGIAIRELADRLVEEARRAEEARVRLELSERAQSTLEAELAEERRRREVAERDREDAQRERDELRRRLEAPRGPEPPNEIHEAASTHEIVPRAPETPTEGFGTDAAGGGPQRQAWPRWWRRWRRS